MKQDIGREARDLQAFMLKIYEFSFARWWRSPPLLSLERKLAPHEQGISLAEQWHDAASGRRRPACALRRIFQGVVDRFFFEQSALCLGSIVVKLANVSNFFRSRKILRAIVAFFKALRIDYSSISPRCALGPLQPRLDDA